MEGKLRSDLSPVDAMAACFPAGTLTGAPKVRAMEIIEEVEPVRRGIYGGAVLYADFAGNLDSCIAIRTMLVKGKKAYVQAGPAWWRIQCRKANIRNASTRLRRWCARWSWRGQASKIRSPRMNADRR